MKNLLRHISALLLFLPAVAFSQTLQLGILSSFEAFTGAGAVTNSGNCNGDAGTNDGIVTGFSSPSYTGRVHNNSDTTVQGKIDILRVYIHLNDIFVTEARTHAPAFGGGETLFSGVYSIGGAGSIGGALTLDGQGDPDAVFIIKYLGAMSVGAGTIVTLTNGTRAANVYWLAEGAISVAAGCTLKGTLFAHEGAISLAPNCDLEGRMLSTGGALTIGVGSVASMAAGPIAIPITCVTVSTPAFAVDVLGSIDDFTLFTSAGAVSNTATSGVIGNIGTNGGSISGFGSSTVIGSDHTADAITEQAKVDLDNAYNQLMLLPNTVTTHPPAFGYGEILTEGVYFIGGAGSLSGTITLDAQFNPDAIFVFKFAGALAVAAQSKVLFANATHRNNVFWISGAGVATGAASLGAFTFMKGTVLAHGGACNVGAGGFVEGRLLSTAGEVGFSSGVIFNDPLCFPPMGAASLPIELLNFTAEAKDSHIQVDWITASEINNDYFTVERSADGTSFTSIFKINGAGNSTDTENYSAIDDAPIEGWSYYRLKQTDYDGKATYSKIVAVEFNNGNEFNLNIYPNPFSEQTVFHTTKNFKGKTLVVYNHHGRVVKRVKNMFRQQYRLNCKNLTSGFYFVTLLENGEVVATDKLLITD